MKRDQLLRQARSKALLVVDSIDRAIEALGGDESDSDVDLIESILFAEGTRHDTTCRHLSVIQGAR